MTTTDRTVPPGRESKALLEAWGANLRRARRRAGLTQEQLEQRAGLDHHAARSLELGHSDASLSMWHDIAVALGVDLGELTHIDK